MRKRILSTIIAMLLVFSIIPMSAKADTHVHTNMTKWDATDSLPDTPGSYYLDNDVTLSTTWCPQGETTLCLNGHVIKGNGSFRIVRIENDVTLNLNDCGTAKHYFTVDASGLWTLADTQTEYFVTGGCITGGGDAFGGGVYINGGTFEMFGGNIVGNKTTTNSDGGGVYASGYFIMHDGSITGNNARHCAGGLYVHPDSQRAIISGGSINNNTAAYIGGVCVNGTLFMYDGKISGNRTTDPNQGTTGGVCVISGKSFTMHGGEISDNYAHKTGGGVKADGTFTLSDGKIVNNTAGINGGGVYCETSGTVSVGTIATVTGNKAGLSGSETTNNVYLPNGKTLDIPNSSSVLAPKNGMSVGISMQTPGQFTNTGMFSRYTKYFHSDDDNYGVGLHKDGYLELGTQYFPEPEPDPMPEPDPTPDPEPEQNYLDDIIIPLTIAIENNETGTIYTNDFSLSYDVVEMIRNSKMTVEMHYTYQGIDYVVIFNKDNLPTEKLEWYGPAYLARFATIDGKQLSKKTSTANGSKHTVVPGDTLNAIAAKYHTTVPEILKKNPFIKEADWIYPGQVLDL